jgi:[ribosomal protein S18]-alanine N-acetyltransferase
MNRRLEAISGDSGGALAAPLSMLHKTCFPKEPWEPEAMAQITAMAGFFGWLVWEDDEPVGFALALDLGGECEILALGVVPGRRRAGTGLALLAATCEEALRRGGDSVFLEVAADNAGARALYAVGGFVQIGRRPDYYRRPGGPADAFVLRRAIGRVSLST